MTQHALQPPVPSAPPPAEGLRDADLAFIRVMGARCRCGRRVDLLQACAQLSANKSRAADAIISALIQGLDGQDGTTKLRLFEPNAEMQSFDERWILAGLAAARRGDLDSLNFLLTRRLPKEKRRQIGFLIGALARALDDYAAARAKQR